MENTSKARFEVAADKFLAGSPYSTKAQGVRAGSPTRDYSVDRFLRENPEFLVDYNDLHAPAPTAQERSSDDGFPRFRSRGGWFFSRGVVAGEIPIALDFLPYVCKGWCRGCVTDFWPYGVPTCIQPENLSAGSGWKWALFVARRPSSFFVTMGRVPKTTYERINDGLGSFLTKLDTLTAAICANHTQAAGAAAMSGDPQAAGASIGMSELLRHVCVTPGAPGAVQTPPTPPKPKTGFDFSFPITVLPTVPEVSPYPSGSIALFDPKTTLYRVAIPRIDLAGVKATHQEIEVVPSVPTNVHVVSRAEWDRSTKPLYRRTSFLIGAGVVVAGAVTAGIVLRRRRSEKALSGRKLGVRGSDIRRGSWVTMLRTYLVRPGDINSPKIERGMRVRVSKVEDSALWPGQKKYYVTDGEFVIGPIGKHVFAEAFGIKKCRSRQTPK